MQRIPGVTWPAQLGRGTRRVFLQNATLLASHAMTGSASAQEAPGSVGRFEAGADVGRVEIPGGVAYDEQMGVYRITGAGENMWFATDAFHFVYRKLSGNVRLASDIAFEGEGKNPHRKAVLMLRQSLDADAAYVDIAVHGDGLTSMQFRGAKGANTQELQFGKPAPYRAELVREGNLVWVRLDGEEMRLGGRSVRMENFLRGEIYAGLGVCSHEAAVSETALFRNVDLVHQPRQG